MKFIIRIIVTSVIAFGLAYILNGIKIDIILDSHHPGNCVGNIECDFKTNTHHTYSSYYHSYTWVFFFL